MSIDGRSCWDVRRQVNEFLRDLTDHGTEPWRWPLSDFLILNAAILRRSDPKDPLSGALVAASNPRWNPFELSPGVVTQSADDTFQPNLPIFRHPNITADDPIYAAIDRRLECAVTREHKEALVTCGRNFVEGGDLLVGSLYLRHRAETQTWKQLFTEDMLGEGGKELFAWSALGVSMERETIDERRLSLWERINVDGRAEAGIRALLAEELGLPNTAVDDDVKLRLVQRACTFLAAVYEKARQAEEAFNAELSNIPELEAGVQELMALERKTDDTLGIGRVASPEKALPS